jgi:ADP-dependent NAD(P)H-hydrate dehydratase / NAD(P)H-hydrate epimerase
MLKIVSAKQMQDLDKITINDCGIPGSVLMENAGKSVVNFILKKFFVKGCKKIAVICGSGNNGGDGFVVARYLYNNNIPVIVFVLAEKEKLTGDALCNYKIIERIGVKIKFINETDNFDKYYRQIKNANIIIDAIFGTGLKGTITGYRKTIIQALNSLQNKIKISVDIPSGIIADSNVIPETYFATDYTITFGLPKLAFFLEPVCHNIGKLFIKDISFPSKYVAKVPSNIFLVNLNDINISKRMPDFHKGNSGKVLVVGGSKGLTGASVLTAKASLHFGAGLVTVACPESLNYIFETKLTECMTLPVSDNNGYLNADAYKSIKNFYSRTDMIAFGPGIGRDVATTELLKKILFEFDKPLIIDADGLFHLSKQDILKLLKNYKSKIIITPHYGEFSRLIGLSIEQILKDKYNILRNFAIDNDTIVVLKGKYTSIAFPDGNIYVINAGNELLATGGTGDVLTGVLSSFITKTGNINDNIISAVFFHSYIADMYKKNNYKFIVASDLINYKTNIK